MELNENYPVQLDVFEGPLDLLLYLIKKNEVDVYDIPIEAITRQYMEYLRLMRMLDLSIAGEFIVMPATLMMIKSRMLLPVEERSEEEDDEEDDPRWDLVRQLVEYKKFKDAALALEGLEEHRENVFPREAEKVNLGPDPEMELRDASIFDLITAFSEALRQVREDSLPSVFDDQYTVAGKLDDIVTQLRTTESLSLTGLLKEMKHRGEMVCAFLALLELIKLRHVQARQEGAFGEILLFRRELDVENSVSELSSGSEIHHE